MEPTNEWGWSYMQVGLQNVGLDGGMYGTGMTGELVHIGSQVVSGHGFLRPRLNSQSAVSPKSPTRRVAEARLYLEICERIPATRQR